MQISKEKDNIQVIIRVRPLCDKELQLGARSCLQTDENEQKLIIDSKPDPKAFIFDYVAAENVNQAEIFQAIGKSLTSSCLEGYNVCIFAYGQTGAGKTYTMQGKGYGIDSVDPFHKGLQPRVFEHLFFLMNNMKKNGCEFLLKCTYLEIYNEQIMDLLSNENKLLQLREDIKKGPYVENLTEEIVGNSEKIMEIFRKGMKNRHIGSTSMNFESSRSHSVFTLSLESKQTINNIVHLKTSKLNFVDLAGSERQKQSQVTGERLKEAGNINKSLTVLGLVINSLVENSQGKNRHVPYRDSKLTFILRDSLGGNSKTCMIAAVTAASNSFAETLSTLKFAQRAKMIKNKALINEENEGNLENLKAEIRRLKEELLKSKEITPDPSKLEHLMRESLSQNLEDRRLLKDFIEKNNESKNNEHLIEENKRKNEILCNLNEALKKALYEKDEAELKAQKCEESMENERNRAELMESEKKRIQEEYEIMYSTYCYESEEKNARISFLENQLTTFESKNIEYLSEICNLNGKLSAFEEFNNTFKITILEKEKLFSENKLLNENINKIQQTQHILNNKIEELNQEILNLNEEKLILQSQSEEYQSILNEKNLEILSKNEFMNNLQNDLSLKQETIFNLQKEINYIKQDKKSTEELLENILTDQRKLINEKDQLSLELNKLNIDFDGLNEENKKTIEEKENLENDLNTLLKNNEELFNLKENLENKLNNEKSKSESEVQKLNEALELIKDKLKEKDKKIEQLFQEIQEKELEISETLKVTTQLQNVLEQNKEFFGELENLPELKKLNEKLLKEKERNEIDINNLKIEKNSLKEKCVNLEYSLEALRITYKNRENEIKNFKEQKKVLDTNFELKDKEIIDLNSKLNNLRKENMKISQDLRSFKTEREVFGIMHEKTDEYKEELKEKDEKIIIYRLKEENKNCKDEIQRQKELILGLNKKIEELSKKLKTDPKKILIDVDETIKLKSEIKNINNQFFVLQENFDKISEKMERFFKNSILFSKNSSLLSFPDQLDEFLTTLKLRESVLLDRENNLRINESKNAILKHENEFLRQQLENKNNIGFSPKRINNNINWICSNFNINYNEPCSERIGTKTKTFIEDMAIIPRKKLKLK